MLCWEMTDLTKSIQNLYKDEISQDEAEIAKGNLVSFFRTLQRIEKNQSQHKINITKKINKEVTKTYKNENNRN